MQKSCPARRGILSVILGSQTRGQPRNPPHMQGSWLHILNCTCQMDSRGPSRPYTRLSESGENHMIPIARTKTMIPVEQLFKKCVLSGAFQKHIIHISCKIICTEVIKSPCESAETLSSHDLLQKLESNTICIPLP